MKTLSKNKQLFLKIVELVNKQLKNTDHHLSKAEAISLYDKEIAPYGYPSHQSLLIEKGMSMIQFNSEVVNRRKLLWFYLEEIKNDNYLRKFLILD